jgi:hypothetical protein
MICFELSLDRQKSSAREAGGSDSCSTAKTLRVASCRRPIAAQFTGQEGEHKIDLVVVWLLRINLLFSSSVRPYRDRLRSSAFPAQVVGPRTIEAMLVARSHTNAEPSTALMIRVTWCQVRNVLPWAQAGKLLVTNERRPCDPHFATAAAVTYLEDLQRAFRHAQTQNRAEHRCKQRH